MEADQTGFSGSPPSTNGSAAVSATTNGNDHRENTGQRRHQQVQQQCNDRGSPNTHTTLLKEKTAKDELDSEDSVENNHSQQQQLPSINEVESWRTTAYYPHPLVAVIDDSTALYDTYKLPSLAKFGKGITALGKLPAIWSVAVTSPEDSQGIPTTTTVVSSSDSPVGSPSPIEHQQRQHNLVANNTPTTIYLRGVGGEKERSVIIQQVMPDGSVQLRPLSDLQHSMVEDDDSQQDGKSVHVDPDLPPLAPAAVEVKREHSDHTGGNRSNHDSGGSDHSSANQTTTVTVSQEMPLQGTAYLEAPFEEPNLGTGQYSVLTNVVVASPPEYTTTAAAQAATGLYTLTAASTDYYRESLLQIAGNNLPTDIRYYAQTPTTEQYAQAVRQHLATVVAASGNYPQGSAAANGGGDADGYVEQSQRFVGGQRTQGYKVTAASANGVGQNAAGGLAVDLPSPDSGIGGEAAAAVTPRDTAALQQIFDYADIGQPQVLLPDQDPTNVAGTSSASTSPVPSLGGPGSGSATTSRKHSWSGSTSSEYGRTPDADKIHIPKLFSDVGFRYYLESPISTSQRRDDDRMTYINKGQYYGLTLEYIPDPDRPLRSCTVKSLVMLVFREEKSAEDELKAWKFWHSRQHSVKQRILDVDTKNSSGVVGQIEEVTHNAISFYWNPLDGPAKVSVSVHCLSTDFSNQKGVKGLPLHLQIDTTDDLRENSGRTHRGYCQIKVFCDKGAERKTRDEERRAAKRKLTATPNSRKKLDEMYHPPCERSEFYSMSDLAKPPVLFMPQDDHENCNGPELTFYAIATVPVDNPASGDETKPPIEILPPAKKMKLGPPDRGVTHPMVQVVQLHQGPDLMGPKKRIEKTPPTLCNTPELTPVSYPWDSSVMLYVKRPDEDVFHPLHLVPANINGLTKALEVKYGMNSDMVRHVYKRCKKGITVEMDDEMVEHYCNEDTFLLDIIKTEDGHFDVTLVEF